MITLRYHHLLVLNERIGHYRITARLGQGGMGEIFSAFDEKLNRTVAIKLISRALLDSEQSRRLFLREARAAAALDHPFICTVHEVLEHDDQPMIVMECVKGETLQQRLTQGPLPIEELCQRATEIAEALGAAHARGIVHRDIKSGNIMLTASGHVKVMDFGLAMIVEPSGDDETARVSEQKAGIAGTLPYIAPEVLRGEGSSASSDLYALGVVMYEMATGRRPFVGKTDAVLVSEILRRDPTPPRQLNSSVPRPLEELILKLLAKEQSRRPPSAAEVIAQLQKIATPRKEKAEQSLAVLPFRALTPDPESAHLGLALADAITSELALVRSLLVRPTAAILRYQEANVDPIAVGQELGVDAIVAGTYQRAGSRLRVSVQLVSVFEERPLWSTRVDSSLDDVFAMQDEVSRKIVDALQVELTPGDEQRFAKRLQASGDVLELCLKGRVALLQETVGDVNAAIELFDQAREIDPRNPLPWLGLSDAYCRLAFTWDPDAGWHERARQMCDEALKRDPDIAEGHYIRGRLAWTPDEGFQHEYAMREIAVALAERPNLIEGFDRLATIMWHVGLIDEAFELFTRALAINPDDPFAIRQAGTLEALRGNYEESLRVELEAASKHDDSWGLHAVAFAQIHVNDLAAAERTIDGAARRFPSVALYDGLRATIAALRGDESAAMRAIEKTVHNRRAFGHFHHVEFDVACTLATLHRNDEALTWLRSCVGNGFPCLAAVENEPLLAPLRSERGYEELLGELRGVRDYYRGVYQEVRKIMSSF
jgi:TolB-like protein